MAHDISLHFADNIHKEGKPRYISLHSSWNIDKFFGKHTQIKKLRVDISLAFADNIHEERNYSRVEILMNSADSIH